MTAAAPKPARAPGLLLAACISAVLAAPAQAREPLYGMLDNEGLLSCEASFWSGQRSDAESCYRGLLTTPQPILVQAEALWALGDLQGANGRFQQATNDNPDDAMLRLRWGELFMQTYQYQEAYNLFTEALEREPNNFWAHLGAAQAMREGGGDPAMVAMHMEAADTPLAPAGVRFRARLMQIHAALQQDRFDQAREALDEAFRLARANDLPLLELHALEAAFAFMRLQPHEAHVEAALALNPAYGDAWFIPGYFASITRRYREAGEFFTKAVQVQPDHWEAHLELGQNHLRLNNITEAQDHVRTAYAGDAFNPRAVNLLRLLDTFIEDMRVLSYPDPPEGAFPRLVLRLAKKEADVIKDYARDLSLASIDLYSQRYRFEPKAPVIVEIFPNHEDFVVRSIGMPGVGILGVTFGYLFAMDSPTAHPRGESYHWGTTLWHEMAHVFTLEITNHLVPRWFSEGISVFEEWRTGPIPGRKIPLNVYQAMAEGKFLSIAELDDGFMRPTYEDQVIVSYMQAGLVFEFIDIEYGFEPIVDMLYQFRDGASPTQAIEKVLGISVADFDRHFEQFIQLEYGQLLPSLQVWEHDMQAAFQALDQENWQEAVAAADRAIFTFPDYVEPDSAYIAKARALARLGNSDDEFRTLETFWQKGGYAARTLMSLAGNYRERGDEDNAMRVLRDVLWADPFREDVHLQLGDLLLKNGSADRALREYEVLMALNPVDRAQANLKLAQAHRALGNSEATMEYLMTALDIAPQYRPAQQMLLELTRRQ